MAAVTQVRILVSAVSHTVVAEVLSFSKLQMSNYAFIKTESFMRRNWPNKFLITSEAIFAGFKVFVPSYWQFRAVN